MRRIFALAVVAMHGLLLLLLVSGVRLRPDAERQVPSFESIWIRLHSPVQPAEESPDFSMPAGVAESPSGIDETSGSDAIEAAESQPTPALEPADAPSVDWMGEAELAARRAAVQPEKRESFGEPPKALREPCKFRQPSMEWNGPDLHRFGRVGIFPYVAIGYCVFSIGFFSCTFDPMPPNTHILDDMKDRDRTRASVPDKELCE